MHVVATAGHVDHGKSTLVRALTGMEPDRWAEERRRGMTIDLGYAWTCLPSGADVAFVDVPGHQRFIANMLAGIGPAPAVLFVVAADEGWSRQSEEHLAAIDALGVRQGLLAVTRSDLADPAAAMTQARQRLAASSLAGVDAVAVSGATGAGLDELRAALDRLVTQLPMPDAGERVRFWIDRAFSVRGSGTVVTGTLSAGSVAVGSALSLRGEPVVVRALQTTGTSRRHVAAGARVALNLRGVARGDVARGDVLLTPGAWHLTSTVDVRLAGVDPLPGELVLHIGTVAVAARIRPLSGPVVRLGLATALPLRVGDRAVLRDPGRQCVASGVLVLDPDPPPLTRRGAAAARGAALAERGEDPDPQAELERRGAVPAAHLRRLGVAVSDIAARRIDDWLVLPARWQRWLGAAPEIVDRWALGNPLEPAMPAAALRRALELPDDPALLRELLRDTGLQLDAGRVTRPGTDVDIERGAVGIRALVDRLRSAPFRAPDRNELDELGLGRRELAAADKAGLLLRLPADIVLLSDAADLAVTTLRALPQPFTTSDARQALDTTRRVAIPLLEHLDALGRTERVDGTRRIMTAS